MAGKMKAEQEALLRLLRERFEQNMDRHEGLVWAEVQAKLEANPDKLPSLRSEGSAALSLATFATVGFSCITTGRRPTTPEGFGVRYGVEAVCSRWARA